MILGKGPLRAAVQRRVQDRGLGEAVRFVEWLDSGGGLSELYSKSRLLVCASTCEGGPRVTVEAMACGTPVVSTPVGVMGDLLADGRGGILCGFEASEIAEAIEQALEDEEQGRGRGSAAREIAEGFEYKRILEGYARGLHDLSLIHI